MKYDTLNRRLRFALPQPSGKNIVLSERDHLIFEIINRHGPLPSTYLFDLTRHLAKGKDHKRFQARLTKLYNGYCTNWRTHTYELIDGEYTLNPKHSCDIVSYLSRPDWQQATGTANYQPIIYDLNPLSQAVLEERGVRIINRADYHLHRFMGACAGASLKLYLESQRFAYSDLHEILNHPKCPPDTRKLDSPLAIPVNGKALIPDDLFAIEKDKPSFYAVEIDRKTESITSDVAKTSIARKMEHYIEALKGRAFYHHFGIPDGRVFILIITTNPTHMKNMQAYARTLDIAFAKRLFFSWTPGFGKNWSVPGLIYLKWEDVEGEPVQLG